MYACIYHINITIRVTVQKANVFRTDKKQKVSDPPREACPATHPE